jgi:hypothetical protein
MNGYDEARYNAIYGDDSIPESPMMKRIFETPTYTEEENEWCKWFMGEEKSPTVEIERNKKSA